MLDGLKNQTSQIQGQLLRPVIRSRAANTLLVHLEKNVPESTLDNEMRMQLSALLLVASNEEATGQKLEDANQAYTTATKVMVERGLLQRNKLELMLRRLEEIDNV